MEPASFQDFIAKRRGKAEIAEWRVEKPKTGETLSDPKQSIGVLRRPVSASDRPSLFRWLDQKLQGLLGATHRLEAMVGARQQQRAFELAQHRGRDQIGLVGRHPETLQPAFDFVFPFLKGIARGGA